MSKLVLTEIVSEATSDYCLLVCERISRWSNKIKDMHFFYGSWASGFVNVKTLEPAPDDIRKQYLDMKLGKILSKYQG